jgi:non-ribosomal peptide synthetase component F
MPVAALGVMKAGGASIAVDITQPESRLKSVVSQANSVIIVSSVKNKGIACRLGGRAKDVVILGPSCQTSSSAPPILPIVDPSSAPYVVFTSGTTGNPKGVVITHRNYSTAIAYQ